MSEKHQPAWFREIDHTGDIGIVVTASSLAQLFERAAWGLFRVLTDPETVRPEQAQRITVEASDREALLVHWLSELNFLHITRRQLFAQFEVKELGDTHLVVEARGEPIDRARHTVYTEVKAVTFHGLEIEQTGGTWRAQIIFDM